MVADFVEYCSFLVDDDSFESDGGFSTDRTQVGFVGTHGFLIKTESSNPFCPPFIHLGLTAALYCRVQLFFYFLAAGRISFNIQAATTKSKIIATPFEISFF